MGSLINKNKIHPQSLKYRKIPFIDNAVIPNYGFIFPI